MYPHGTICPQYDASFAGISASGRFVWMISVAGSGASARAIVWNMGLSRAALTDGS